MIFNTEKGVAQCMGLEEWINGKDALLNLRQAVMEGNFLEHAHQFQGII